MKNKTEYISQSILINIVPRAEYARKEKKRRGNLHKALWSLRFKHTILTTSAPADHLIAYPMVKENMATNAISFMI